MHSPKPLWGSFGRKRHVKSFSWLLTSYILRNVEKDSLVRVSINETKASTVVVRIDHTHIILRVILNLIGRQFFNHFRCPFQRVFGTLEFKIEILSSKIQGSGI